MSNAYLGTDNPTNNDLEKYTYSAINVYNHGTFGGKNQPFNYVSSVREFKSWVFAATMLVANAFAKTQKKLYVKRGKNKLWETKKLSNKTKNYLYGDSEQHPSNVVLTKAFSSDYEEVIGTHPIMKVLNNPNPYLSGFGMDQAIAINLWLTGNYYMYPIVSNLGQYSVVESIYTVPSQHVRIIPSKPGDDCLIDGYVYGQDSMMEQRFSTNEIKHLKLIENPDDILYGLGRVQAGWPIIKLANSQRITDQARMDNNARPDLVVIDKKLKKEQQFKQQAVEWSKQFRGSFRSGNAAFLNGDMTVFPLEWAPTDVGLHDISLDELASVMGVPVTLLKTTDPNLSNAEIGLTSWREMTILPLCQLVEAFYNSEYLSLWGEDVAEDCLICYENPVPENRESMLKERELGLKYGYITRNEVRLEDGLLPYADENADALLVPQNITPIQHSGVRGTERLDQKDSPEEGLSESDQVTTTSKDVVNE